MSSLDTLVLGFTDLAATLVVYVVLRDLNSGPHTYLIVTISTKPSL